MIDISPHDPYQVLKYKMSSKLDIHGDVGLLHNWDIVGESFEFVESVNSTKDTKFGLCESSMVKFQTIGCDNMKGKELYAGIDISYKQNGGGLTKTVKIPIGYFTVAESRRKTGNSAVREVIAYSTQSMNDSHNSKYTTSKVRLIRNLQSRGLIPKSVDFDIFNLMYENNYLQDYESKATVEMTSKVNTYSCTYFDVTTGTRPTITVAVTCNELTLTPSDTRINDIYFNHSQGIASTNKNFKDKLLDSIDKSSMFSNQSLYQFIESFNEIANTKVTYKFNNDQILNQIVLQPSDVFFTVSEIASHAASTVISVPQSVKVSMTKSYTESTLFEMKLYGNLSKIDGYTKKTYISSFENMDDVNIHNIAESYFELLGMQTKQGRKSGILSAFRPGEIEKLYPNDSLYPSDELLPMPSCDMYITKDMYIDCKYDDETSSDFIGIIEAEYTDTEGIQRYMSCDTNIPDGERSYDISNNVIIKHTKFSSSEIQEILSTIALSINDYMTTSFSLNAIGIPWLEAGDVIYVETDNGWFTSIIGSRTLSGIKSLRDRFESN